MVYAAVADLIHNIKSDLSFEQLTRIVHVYSSLLFNPTLGFNLHILFSKVLFGLADTIVTKDTPRHEQAHLFDVRGVRSVVLRTSGGPLLFRTS